MLELYIIEEQPSIARFVGNANDIHREVFPVYIEKYLSRKALQNWVDTRKYPQGPSKIVDDERPSRPLEIPMEATVQRVEELIRADRRITIASVATALGCSHGLAYSTIHDHLKFRKVCARWMSRELKDRGKK
jgi:hypothetical protein